MRELLDWALAAVGRSWARSSSSGRVSEANVVWEASPATGIVTGATRDSVAIGQLLRHGTSGLGLDESARPLVVVDRRCFRLAPAGRLVEAPSGGRAVFAALTTFSPDVVATVSTPTDPAALAELVDAALPRGAFLVCVRIEAAFSWLRVRDEERGADVPSSPTVSDRDAAVEWRGRVGTLIGFRTPDRPGGGATAVQFAYVDRLRDRGGFVADFVIEHADVELSFSTDTRLAVPRLGVMPGPRHS